MDFKTNIFCHSPKELTTDAFLVWIIYFLDSREEYKTYKQSFFNGLLLKKEDSDKYVENISLVRQENRVDVLLHFTFAGETTSNTILFEDKTWSMPHDGQLDIYKKYYPDCYRYIYFKLAYLNSEENNIITEAGYELLDANMMSLALNPIVKLHPLIEMYKDYIDNTFCKPINSYHSELFEKHNYNILWDAEAQKYLCDEILNRMIQQNVHILKIRNGSSYGRPWTQIDIAEKKDGYCEWLFWRVDIRSGKFYIRLNQYSDPLDSQIDYKNKRRDILREAMNKLVLHGSGCISGSLTDAKKETEIAIFYFEDNDFDKLLDKIPSFTKEIVKVFNSLQ